MCTICQCSVAHAISAINALTHLRGTCECVNNVDGTCLMYMRKVINGINHVHLKGAFEGTF